MDPHEQFCHNPDCPDLVRTQKFCKKIKLPLLTEVSPRLCRGTHRGLSYAAVEKDEASYSAGYFICIPPFSKGGQGGFMAVVCRASATKSPSIPLLQRGKAELQPPWTAMVLGRL
jgi:hypothetical protein